MFYLLRRLRLLNENEFNGLYGSVFGVFITLIVSLLSFEFFRMAIRLTLLFNSIISTDPAASSSSLKSRSHDSLRSSSCHPKLTAMDNHTDPDKSGSSERRMARYKEERRRQLASHVKDRLSGGGLGGGSGGHHLESRRSRKRSSSSSSDDNEVQEVGTVF